MANSLLEKRDVVVRNTFFTLDYVTFAPTTSTPTAPGDPTAQYCHDGVTWHDCDNIPQLTADGYLTLLPAETNSPTVWVRITDGDALVDPVCWHAETTYPFHTATSPAAMGVASATSQGLTAALTATPSNLPFLGDRLLSEIPAGMFLGWGVWIVTGTGAGQFRYVRGFDPDGGGAGYAQFALDKPWATGMTPDATSTFALCYLGSEAAAASSLLTNLWSLAGAEGGFVLGDANGRGAASVEEIVEAVLAILAQNTADGLKLEPSAGDADEGSAQKLLEDAAVLQDSIAERTDRLPDSPAAVGSAMTLTSAERISIGTAVWATTARTLTAATNITADIAAAVWAALTSALTVAGSIGKKLADWVPLTAATAETACEEALTDYDAATGTEVGNLAATTIITVASAEQTDVARCYADSAPWAITVQTDAGVAVDLTDLTLYMGIDKHQTTLYASASVKLDSTPGGGLTVISAVNGQIEVDAGELDGLAVGDWWYTLRRANVAGETLTLVRGKLEVRWAI